MKYYLTIDAGTSVIKTVIFDINFKQIISNKIAKEVFEDIKSGMDEKEALNKFMKKVTSVGKWVI